jgi:thiamine biosynthesis lipoprotein
MPRGAERTRANTGPPALLVPPLAWGELKVVHRFRAMNTTIELNAMDPAAAPHLAAVERSFHEIEARCSRFREASELSRFNARTASRIAVSPDMAELLALAQRFHATTGGVFEPAVLPQLEAAGYDRSFEQVERESAAEPDPHTTPQRWSIADVRIDAEGVAEAPAGLRIDLGGIGKGFAVDRAARMLAPVRNALVNAGGDMAAIGHGSDGDGWVASVDDPFEPGRPLSLLRLHDEALATSSRAARWWRRGDAVLHHIIDPRTGAPARNDIVSVTVVAPAAVQADVFAKCALILGRERGIEFLEKQGVAGMLVFADRSSATTARWPGQAPGGM